MNSMLFFLVPAAQREVILRNRWRGPSWLGCALIVMVLGLTVSTAHGQGQRQKIVGSGSYPPLAYYSAFHSLREGELDNALELFEEVARSGIRSIDGPWIDSVCSRVMVGEVLLRQGKIPLAMDQYNAALNLMIHHRTWISRVEFPSSVAAFGGRISPPVLWGGEIRVAPLADVPERFQIVLGNLDNEGAVRRGGVVVAREIHSINVHEVIRCTCLAMRRRYELLGPVAAHDPLTARTIAALDTSGGPPNHWTQSWMNVQRGWALAVAGKNAEAVNAFRASVLLAGRFDHPLTPTALMGLGYMAQEAGEPGEAIKYFVGASASAAVFEEIETVEDALIGATDSYLAGAPNKPLGALDVATQWAIRKRLPHLSATAGVLSAENLAAMRQSGAAIKLLTRARGAFRRRAQLAASVGARAEFVAAQANYQQGKHVAAVAAFRLAMERQRSVSPWLYQIDTTVKMYRGRSNSISQRSLGMLFDQLLREPTRSDWGFRTQDTLAFVLHPNRPAYEDWFELMIRREDYRKAIEIGEAMRRREFYRALPLGGRVLALRWVLEAPTEILSEPANAARRDLLARYPAYKEASDQARALREQLSKLPIDGDPDQETQQRTIGQQLDKVSQTQEAILGELALRREACPFEFPPLVTSKSLQESLRPKQLALIYVATANGMHAFMMSRDNYVHWNLPNESQLRRDTMLLLKQWGLTGENAQITTEVLRSDEWNQAGQNLLRAVIDRGQHGFWKNYDELVIVPDGVTWYVPFEGLPIDATVKPDASIGPSGADPGTDPGAEPAASPVAQPGQMPLISQIRIRHVPAAGLINAKRLAAPRGAKTAVVIGKLFPRDDLKVAETQLEALQQVFPSAVPLPSRLSMDSGLLRSVWGGLVVYDDISDLRAGPLEWSPARVDEGRPGSRLRRWMELPWGGPARVIVPGFHTPAEAGLRSKGDGKEIFLPSMAFLASGTRSLVLARWRTGGQSSYDLVREFMQEDPDVTPSEAWQRALHVIQQSEIDTAHEPRVNSLRDKDPLSGSHPFFWAGYQLIGG